MHDQHNSPSQRPSQDYGPQDFLHLGDDLEQRERERAQAAQAAEDTESWLLDGHEPAEAQPTPPSVPQSALPAAGPTNAAQDAAWLLEMNDSAPDVADGSLPAGEGRGTRSLEATYFEPESSSEVIGRSLHRSLLPAASVLLLTVAAIGGWRMMGSGSMASVEPAPIEFKVKPEPRLLMPPGLGEPVARRDGGGAEQPATTPNVPPRQPVAAPSEPSELAGRPSASEEEYADPFELSDGPARSAEADSTLSALDPLTVEAPDPIVTVGTAFGVPTISPVHDPAVADGPARASLLPPAAWAMPVALSSWARAGALEVQARSQDPVALAGPEGLPTEPGLEPALESALESVALAVAEDDLTVEVDPIDAWLAGDGTVPFSALAVPGEPVAPDEVAETNHVDPEAPVASFVPAEPSEADALVENTADEDLAWQDDFWRQVDELESSPEGVATAEIVAEGPLVVEETVPTAANPELVETLDTTDEVAVVAPEEADEFADLAQPSDDGGTESVARGEVAVAAEDVPSDGALFPWDEVVPLAKGPTVERASEVEAAELDETAAAGEFAAEEEEVAVLEEGVPSDEALSPAAEVAPLADGSAVDSSDEVAATHEEVLLPGDEVAAVVEVPTVLADTEVNGLDESGLNEDEPGDELATVEIPLEVYEAAPEEESLQVAQSAEEPGLAELPALDDERVPATEIGVIDPLAPEADLVAGAETSPVDQAVDPVDEGTEDPADEAALDARITEELASLSEDAGQELAPTEVATATPADDAVVGLPQEPEAAAVTVDSLDGDWFLGGPIFGPDLPEGYAALGEDEVQEPAVESTVDEAPRPKSSLLGNGDLFGQYGDFLRTGRTPSGAATEVADATGEAPLTPEEQARRDAAEAVPDRNGLARAASPQRWDSEELPRHLYDSAERIYTPLVGDVRVELVGGDLLEGQLHSLGTGSVWVDSRAGRIQIELDRVVAVQRLGTVGEVVKSDPSRRDYSKLPHVRVRTAGGVIVGRQLARDGESVTVLTDAGIQMTLQATEVSPVDPRRAVVGLRPR